MNVDVVMVKTCATSPLFSVLIDYWYFLGVRIRENVGTRLLLTFTCWASITALIYPGLCSGTLVACVLPV
ncbi:hypothetical protein B0H13DRAFT_2070561 [Mycena leptocephala]|nr:hypothetical protein B0H13DRAFT_2070561 [Mycena leptocephala]